MRPKHRRRRSRLAPSVVVALAFSAACSGGEPGSSVPSPLAASAPAPDAPIEGEGPTAPALVEWGGQADQLAIVVRNQAEQQIRAARVRIDAFDARGGLVVTTTGDEDSTCCTLLSVPPGEEFGLFVDLAGTPVTDVAEVRVTYVDPVVLEAPTPGAASLDAVALEHTPTDTIVRAALTVDGTVGPVVAGQAFLVDETGRLTAVISGRFWCVADGTRRELRMELLHPTPATTRIDRVLARPVPADVPTAVGATCS